MAVRPRHPVELRDLALDLTQLCFDLAGFVDPTPISDGVSGLIALGRGQWLDAAISGIAMVPYVGDLAKAGKLGRYAESLENAIALAKNSPEAARLLAPVFAKLDQVLRLLPDAPSLQPIRSAVARFLQSHHAARAASLLPDIRRHFSFRRFQRGNYEYVEGAGRLGVPGKVQTFRSPSAQRNLSGGTGDHAGHLFGSRFGAPADGPNLGLQNANLNTRAPRAQQHWAGSGGSYLDLENAWERKLKSGIGIEARIADMYRLGEARPIGRKVQWTEIHPNGARQTFSLDFLNASSPQSRAATGQ